MTYILTNAAAMNACDLLASKQTSLAQTQSELSTGLAVQDAADNVAYWSIAQTMSSDAGALGAVAASLKQNDALLANFSSALTQIISVMNVVKSDFVASQNPGADQQKIWDDMLAHEMNVISIAQSATFGGENWLTGVVGGSQTAGTGTVSLETGYNSTTGVQFASISLASVCLFTTAASAPTPWTCHGGLLGASDSTTPFYLFGTSALNLLYTSTPGSAINQSVMNSYNGYITKLENASSVIGALRTQNTQQMQLVDILRANYANGVASMVDADMNQVSTRLQAEQVGVQLEIQSVSVANQSAQLILKLLQ